MYFPKINLCSKLLPKVEEIMRSNYSREERQKIVEEYIQSGKSQTVFADTVKATKSKHAAQAIKLFKDVFDDENRLRKLFDEEKISEAEFLERRVNDVKPHMDNLHSWLLEKKQNEMILDFSKTKEVVNYCLNRWEKLLPWNIEITSYKIRGEWI